MPSFKTMLTQEETDAIMQYVIKRANDEICVIAQLETPAAVAALGGIAAVPGVDAVFIGPGDLSASLGHIGDIAHPEVQGLIEQAASAARATGTPVAGAPDRARATSPRSGA